MRKQEIVKNETELENKIKENKKKISISISRENGKTYMIFNISPEIEEIFKSQSEEIRESNSWKELKFYYVPSVTQNSDYKEILYRHRLFDDFGLPLYKNGVFNVAFIRTVGGSGKILVNNSIPFAVVSEAMKNIVSFLKDYYEGFIRDYSVKGFITFEV